MNWPEFVAGAVFGVLLVFFAARLAIGSARWRAFMKRSVDRLEGDDK